jgi:hypothetical protein
LAELGEGTHSQQLCNSEVVFSDFCLEDDCLVLDGLGEVDIDFIAHY